MKTYVLDLSAYEVTIPSRAEGGKVEMQCITYPLRENYSTWLRSVGVFKTANDIAEAVSLARAIRSCTEDKLKLDNREATILTHAIDRLVELTAEGKANLGGELHEEAIIRVAKMNKVEDE